MMHYKLVLTGSEIFVENYGDADPIVGFVACRIVKADSESLAIATAKRNILVTWNQSFNADRKVGLPKLSVEKIAPVNRLFARQPKHDYFFYTGDEGRQKHLDKLINKRRWFRRKPKS